MLKHNERGLYFDRNGREVVIHSIYNEGGVDFALISYPDGFLPYDVGGRASGTEDAPIWEHRILDGLVLKSGGNYYSDSDWVIERGLRAFSADDSRLVAPRHHPCADCPSCNDSNCVCFSCRGRCAF